MRIGCVLDFSTFFGSIRGPDGLGICWKVSEVGDAIHFKPGNEGVPVLLTIAFAFEIEIMSEKKFGSFEQGLDKDKFEGAIERMAALLR